MKLAAILLYAAALSIALPGSAVAQSHGHAAKQGEHGTSAGSHMNKAAGHAHGDRKMGDVEVPADLDTATTKLSERERYRVSILPETPPIAINALHSWVLEIVTPDGKPVQDAEVTIDGGMPAHGHGLPTAPRVTEYLGNGKYRIEGVRFNMAGWWQMTFAIKGHHADTATFNIVTK